VSTDTKAAVKLFTRLDNEAVDVSNAGPVLLAVA
jgi:hypothetical protein